MNLKSYHQRHYLSESEILRDWTLLPRDQKELAKYHKKFRLLISIQFCSLRLYGKFVQEPERIPINVISYLNKQLNLEPTMIVSYPKREATWIEQRKSILSYLGFNKFDEKAKVNLSTWIRKKAAVGVTPKSLVKEAEAHLLSLKVIIPGPTTLERLVTSVCSKSHDRILNDIYRQLPASLKKSIDELLVTSPLRQKSYFHTLKEYPPSATISSLSNYLEKYMQIKEIQIAAKIDTVVSPEFFTYLFNLAKNYSAKDLKRFKAFKRHSMVVCFLIETRKVLLDQIVKMHDQYVIEILRKAKLLYEKKHRILRKRQKRATDTMLKLGNTILSHLGVETISMTRLCKGVQERDLHQAMDDLKEFKFLEEMGLGGFLLSKYPSMRKYLPTFFNFPFEAEHGSQKLFHAIKIMRAIDSGRIKKIPKNPPVDFIHKALERHLYDARGKIMRNAWELGIAIALKEALRAGDLFLPQSKQHVSFWNLTINERQWEKNKHEAPGKLGQPDKINVKTQLKNSFNESLSTAIKRFDKDDYARIENGQLKLRKNDTMTLPSSVSRLQKLIDSNLPSIRIEDLLMDVDRLVGFTRKFNPINKHESRPKHFYKTLIASILSQATNLGVVAMSSSVRGITLDMLRHTLHNFIREETITAASAAIVDAHHKLPLSFAHGTGRISSSDGQRFKIRADSLLASYYPRYYGYYEKAIGIYTHVSDQSSVYSTRVISCSPREALYVLDGLLENNTILKIREHTTDTHGYTEIIFALCHILGFYFMPRIKDLKDQQLYRLEKNHSYGEFDHLLTKTADMSLIFEQWEQMLRVGVSLQEKTSPAHVIVQRLTNSYPSDRLSKAFTNLGRILKTQYILRYLTDKALRRTVEIQLNKGEYRHRLPRWIFFANQGEFCTGDYQEIMNKASCLSLVSNAILYWNTLRIDEIISKIRKNGEDITDEDIKHISLLPHKHVLPNGTYFNDQNQDS